MKQRIAIVLVVLLNTFKDSDAFDLYTGRETISSTPSLFLPAASPNNLTADVSAFNVTSKLLQLNVSWSPGQGGPPATSYNLHLKSLNESDPHCATEPYYAFIENAKRTHWTISPKPLITAVHESNSHLIVPDCSYRIRLEANPHDGKTFTEMDITVPGPKIISGSHSAVYNLSWSRNVLASGANMYNETYTASDVNLHVAIVQVVDLQHCLGPEAQLTFLVEGDLERTEAVFIKDKVFWIVLLPIGLFLLLFCLIAFHHIVWCQRCFNLFKLKPDTTHLASCGFFYKAVNIKSERVFRRNTRNSIREWNVLYVEKEIEDAKERGEADVFEISYNRLTIQREIGRGAFGQVFLAKAEAIRGVPGSRLVAVKKLKGSAGAVEKEELLEEISMLKKVGQHPNIVSLLACCTLNSDLCMVMEFVPCGDLLKYLRNLRQKLDARKPSITSMSDGVYSTPSTVMTSLNSHLYSNPQPEESLDLDYILDHRELHNFALQIAKGMAHLEAKRITHRSVC
uniref:Protein kinase domain-containing protein n=1 Tax=Graphocephala atropunctata TaxID=36148 RepID=A0A1B6MGG3_9HEMI